MTLPQPSRIKVFAVVASKLGVQPGAVPEVDVAGEPLASAAEGADCGRRVIVEREVPREVLGGDGASAANSASMIAGAGRESQAGLRVALGSPRQGR